MTGVLLSVLLCGLGGGASSSVSTTSPAVPQVASRYVFSTTGGDWPVPPEAPAPVVDCRGDFRGGSCGATTFTASGSPGLAATYWRPGGGSVAGSGVAFDGVDDYLDGGTTRIGGRGLLCLRFTPKTLSTSWRLMMAQYSGSSGFWIGSITAKTAISIGGTEYQLKASPTAGTSEVTCIFHDPATGVLRANTSGTTAEFSGVSAPMLADYALRIGASSAGAYFYDGSISRVTYWSLASSSWEPSAADLARMVRSQYAAQGSLGEPLTVTRASSKSCSIGGAWFTVPANQPCIGDAGLSVEGARTQYALNNCTAPADQTVTLAAGAHTLWLEGSGSVAAAVGTATATGLPCTATAASACSFTVTVGGTVTLDATGTVDRMQVENGARSSLICATTTPVTRAADVLSVPIPAGARWAIYTLGGTRYTLDVSANASPLTVGVGQELAVTGAISDLHFCASPNTEDCR